MWRRRESSSSSSSSSTSWHRRHRPISGLLSTLSEHRKLIITPTIFNKISVGLYIARISVCCRQFFSRGKLTACVRKKTLKAKSMQGCTWIHINVNKRRRGWSWAVTDSVRSISPTPWLVYVRGVFVHEKSTHFHFYSVLMLTLTLRGFL